MNKPLCLILAKSIAPATTTLTEKQVDSAKAAGAALYHGGMQYDELDQDQTQHAACVRIGWTGAHHDDVRAENNACPRAARKIREMNV